MVRAQVKVRIQSAATVRADQVSFAVSEKGLTGRDFPEEVRAALRSLDVARGSDRGPDHKGARAEAPSRRGRVRVTQIGAAKAADARVVDQWISSEIAAATQSSLKRLVLVLPKVSGTTGKGAARRILSLLPQVPYRFTSHTSAKDAPSLRTVAVVPPAGQERRYRAALRPAEAIAGGVQLCRNLGNTPPNVATPAWMASQARALARRHGMKATVLLPKELEKRGMGGILGVGQGSANTPRLARLSYGTRGPKVALVGKGVTFDTGGISIKPSASMEEMKYDKCGACTVLGVAEAVATLGLDLRLEVYVPLAENMPSAKAYRPSDIVTCYNGKTVEIINTDAEGRMLLADALAWACEGKPDVLLEYSTLTGATVVALGEGGAALYSPSDALAKKVLAAADGAHERLWRMPLWPEFVRQMEGTHSDLKNSGPRWGGGNTAAAFLSQFVDGVEQWAHLDIAGPAYGPNAEGRGRRGATGYGVHFTVSYLEGLASA